jgi:MIP family channel proteins
MTKWQTYLAEMLGTFVLVFAGTTSIVGALRSGLPPLLVAPFAFGLALLAGLYAFAEVSGGHFNPAVSIGLFLDRRIDGVTTLLYIVMQFIGATLASLVLLSATSKNAVKLTATVPSSDGTAFVMELVFSAIFVLVILQSTKSERFGGTALVAIPLTLLAIHFAAIPFSGASVNPARTFGPALVGDVWKGFWIYMIAPPLGAIIAWLVHVIVVGGETDLGATLSSGDEEATSPA